MNALLRRLCRARAVPLAMRRQLGRMFVPYSDRDFALEIDGTIYRGRLDSYIEWLVWVTGQFFEFTYLNLVRSFQLGGTAVDVGANVGNHSLALSTMFDEVIAIEPYTPLYRRLEEKVGGLSNVRIHPCGFSSFSGEACFCPPHGRNLGTGRVADQGTHRITLIRGDELLMPSPTGSIRFIKIDVEGHEAEVLQGLAGIMARDRPVVMYESFRMAAATRAEALGASFALFPPGYDFLGLRGQTTFPSQRQVAHPVRITPANQARRYAYVLALPSERRLLSPHS
jgi:FkbM family methyltransferase